MQEVKRSETAKEIIERFDRYLVQIVNVLAFYPDFIEDDSIYPNNEEISKGFVFLFRMFEHKHNPVISKHHHWQIKTFFNDLATAGKNLRRNLFLEEDSPAVQLQSLVDFAEGESLQLSLNYFSIISTMGLIRDTIRPIIENLVKHGRIQLTDKFRANLDQLGNDTTQRGSKLAFLIQSWRDQKERELDQEQVNILNRVHHRISLLCSVTNHLMNICEFPPTEARNASLFQIADGETPEIRLLRNFADVIPPKYIMEILQLKRDWIKGGVTLEVFRNKIGEILAHIAERLDKQEDFPNYFDEYTTQNMQEVVDRINLWIAGKVTAMRVLECIPLQDPTEEVLLEYNY